MPHVHTWLTALALLTPVFLTAAEPDDDPLPAGAIARLETASAWNGGVVAVAVAPDGKQVAWAAADRSLHLWDVGARKETRTWKGASGRPTRLAFAPDGKTLAVAWSPGPPAPSQTLRLLDVATGQLRREVETNAQRVYSLQYFSDGTLGAAEALGVSRWDPKTGEALLRHRYQNLDLRADVSDVAYSPDGKAMAVAAYNGHVWYLELQTPRRDRLPAAPPNCAFVAFTPDGKTLATAGSDTLRFWSVATGEETRPFQDAVADRLAFAPDGKTVAWTSRGGAIRLGAWRTGKQAEPLDGHVDEVTDLSFAANGKLLATGSSDGTVLLWDLSKAKFDLSDEEARQRTPRSVVSVPKGAKVTLEFDHKEFFLGENILAHFRIENAGFRPIPIDFGGNYRGATRDLNFHVEAVHTDGSKAPDPRPNQSSMGGLGGTHLLKPGQVYYESLQLPRYVRLEKPGTYRVRASTGLGWTPTKQRPLPAPEATITVVMPTAWHAKELVKNYDRMPKDSGGTHGMKRPPFADYSTLIYPIYLPILTERAQKGDGVALAAIGEMPFPDATKTLITTLDHADAKVAKSALEALYHRLPDPQLEKVVVEKETDYLAARRWMVKQAWKPEFAAGVRKAARKFLDQTDVASIEHAAYLFQCVGAADDLPALTAALDRTAAACKVERGAGWRTRSGSEELRRAVQQLVKRGAAPPAEPKTPGELVLFLDAIAAKPDFRPAKWEQKFAQALTHTSPFIREVAMQSLPQTAPAALAAEVPKRLADADEQVQIAACRWAEKAKRRDLREPLVKILETAKEHWLLGAADNALHEMGASAELIPLWVKRMDEEGMMTECLEHLLHKVVSDVHGWGHVTQDRRTLEDGQKCKAAWEKFLQVHGERLKQGKRFSLADDGVPLKELFPDYTFERPRK